VITEDSVRSVRPGYGLAPKFLNEITGRKVTQAIKSNSPVHWTIIESK
jgi:N-acetylneuraminate synthase